MILIKVIPGWLIHNFDSKEYNIIKTVPANVIETQNDNAEPVTK